jgi:hypothetical protein
MDLNSNKKNYRTEENNLLGLLASNPKQGFSDLYDKFAASLYGVILKNVLIPTKHVIFFGMYFWSLENKVTEQKKPGKESSCVY